MTKRETEAGSQATRNWIAERAKVQAIEGRRHPPRVTTGEESTGLAVFPVPERTRFDWLVSVRQDPQDREQRVLVVQQRCVTVYYLHANRICRAVESREIPLILAPHENFRPN